MKRSAASYQCLIYSVAFIYLTIIQDLPFLYSSSSSDKEKLQLLKTHLSNNKHYQLLLKANSGLGQARNTPVHHCH